MVRLAAGAPVDVTPSEGGDDNGSQLRRFEGVAYAGGVISIGWYGPVCFDLSGVEIEKQKRPTLRDHKASQITGYTEAIEIDGEMRVSGRLTESTEAGREVIALADDEFPWQLSIGAEPPRAGELQALYDEAETAEVNGRTIQGPCLIFRTTRVREVSFVAMGADDDTSAVALNLRGIAASQPTEGGNAMSEEAREAAAKDAVAAERKRVKDIRAEFPDTDDAEFVLEQIDSGASLEQARAAYSKVLRERLKKAEADLADERTKREEAEAKAKAPGRTARKPIPSKSPAGASAAADTGSATERWQAAVKAARAEGLSAREARSRVAREEPELHVAYLEEVNGSPAPSYLTASLN